MRIPLDSDLWHRIYYTLGREALNDRIGRHQMELFFKEKHNIIINTLDDGNWESVDIDDEHLVLILLQIGTDINDEIWGG